ncbi:MAG: cytochrome C peroxidase [Cyanosarcina radialis HA8281-LM2]|jgi:cytochrome c peroxidase|nr:cytochrome C peroxidase [Cyanosarcina radialis HA8281-LM2]
MSDRNFDEKVKRRNHLNFFFKSKLLTVLLGKIRQKLSPTGKKLAKLYRPRSRQVPATRGVAIALLAAVIVLTGNLVSAQVGVEPPAPMGSLKKVKVPEPSNLAAFIKDKNKAIQLGKALFWDMQVGSDGVTACASCHFHAGTDSRSKNQLHPGADRIVNRGLNSQLTAADYPFHKLADPNNRFSTVLSDSNDVTGSQGVFLAKFNGITPGNSADNTSPLADLLFNINGTNVRQVTGRNAPTTVNAVFNFRNFWDGRAQNIFNGLNPFGLRDPNATIYRAPKRRVLQAVKVKIDNASLASQAVGPPLSTVEESAVGRTFPDIGKKFNQRISNRAKKLRALVPLRQQLVARDDSVLGELARSEANKPKTGLKRSYEWLIKRAFKNEWWNSIVLINVDSNGNLTFTSDKLPKPETSEEFDSVPILSPSELEGNQYTLMDFNFPLFMGLSVQLYESTLVSDNAPIDRYFDGTGNLTESQSRGKDLFDGKAKCTACHEGPLFTDAAVDNVKEERLERMTMGDGGQAIYDHGFYNIGVRPTGEDLGVGGKDPSGNPLSESRLAQQGKFDRLLGEKPNISVDANERIAADGAFKTPILRNVELTAPYFHNGGQATLEQVVEFYNRGGDFHEQNLADLDPNIQNLNLNPLEEADLVAFMKALTDDRVKFERAPFDHPQLLIPNGHPGGPTGVEIGPNGTAKDSFLEIPAVGKKGSDGLPTFLSLAD